MLRLCRGAKEEGKANGETPLKVLAPALYEFFWLDTKECYRYYSAIKLRKNPSRTYFIDKMQKKLNEKIRRDEELASPSSLALPFSVATRDSSNKFGSPLAAPSVRASAIQVNLMALGLASVGADEAVNEIIHRVKSQKDAEIRPYCKI